VKGKMLPNRLKLAAGEEVKGKRQTFAPRTRARTHTCARWEKNLARYPSPLHIHLFSTPSEAHPPSLALHTRAAAQPLGMRRPLCAGPANLVDSPAAGRRGRRTCASPPAGFGWCRERRHRAVRPAHGVAARARRMGNPKGVPGHPFEAGRQPPWVACGDFFLLV
jgi:hypothetical protein